MRSTSFRKSAMSQEMATIKQEFIDTETKSEVDLKFIKEEPCSIEDVESTFTVKDEISEMENVTVELVPKDIKFIKCEEDVVFEWNPEEVDPLMLTDEEFKNMKTESSSDINNDLSNKNTEEICMSDINKFSGNVNTTCSVYQQEIFGNTRQEKHVHQELNTDTSNIPDSDIGVANNIEDHQHASEAQAHLYKLHKCIQCNYATGYKSHFVAHIRTHTNKKTFTCSHCSYVTRCKSGLVLHIRTHSGEKPFRCSQCNYATIKKSNLTFQHIRKHIGEKPFTCSQCNYATGRKSSLVMHMKVHASEKPFKCSQCNYAAVNNSNLGTHIRIHSGEKPFTCSQCNYATCRNSNLEIHMRKHTGEKPFKCTQCNFATGYKSSFVVHMRKHFGEPPLKL